MAAGRWVFPIVIVTFIVFLTGYVATQPAEPADSAGRAQRVAPGLNVVVELTQFYDAENEYVAYTTDEAFRQSAAFNPSPAGVGFDASPIELDIPADAGADDDGLFGAMLGRRVGETFTTPRFEDFYGGFTETVTRPTTLREFEPVVTARDGEGGFDYEAFVQAWRSRNNGDPLEVGDRIPCEQGFPWQCEILTLDDGQGVLEFRRLAEDGMEVPVQQLRVPFAPGTPVPDRPAVVRMHGDDPFEVVWQLQAGDTFNLGGTLGDWEPGAYRVTSAAEGQVTADYRPPTGQTVPAHLIGQDVWFRLTIVEVHDHDAHEHEEAPVS